MADRPSAMSPQPTNQPTKQPTNQPTSLPFGVARNSPRAGANMADGASPVRWPRSQHGALATHRCFVLLGCWLVGTCGGGLPLDPLFTLVAVPLQGDINDAVGCFFVLSVCLPVAKVLDELLIGNAIVTHSVRLLEQLGDFRALERLAEHFPQVV
mmetsp:Transcript_46860/g.135036  ORF Transcript_46860/g.135036 Transcript_46860/m.135036 type:complete len:155 (+) Transcript_46860:137-601(+)